MRCPKLSDLPSPPPGKTGWPWTEESPRLPDRMPDGSPWPRISIVTPSYNQGRFIEETIRSVLLQGYPDLEYIIIDGGSTDETVDIIQKYESWLSYWISEPDRGQSHAINKGIRQATGYVISWLNSDDYYYPNIFGIVSHAFHNLKKQGIVFGDARLFRDQTENCGIWQGKSVTLTRLLLHPHIANTRLNVIPCQPSVFFMNQMIKEIGNLREDLTFAMDYEYWLRAKFYRYHFFHIPAVLSNYRFHSESHSVCRAKEFYREWLQISEYYIKQCSLLRKFLVSAWWCLKYVQVKRQVVGDQAHEFVVESLKQEYKTTVRIKMLIQAVTARYPIITTKFFWGAVRRIY